MKHLTLLVLASASILAGTGCGSTARHGGASRAAGAGDSGVVADTGAPAAGTNECRIHSGYPGDELCILPPNPGEGIQIHAGPRNYDDPAEVAPWLVAPGEENVRCFLAEVPEGGFHYLTQKNRMRTGSHHMLISLEDPAGRAPGPTTAGCSLVTALGAVPGSQTPVRDFPAELAPEDTGLARWLLPNTIAGFQLHYVNTGPEAVMREAWVNLYTVDEADVTQELQGIFLLGDLGVNVPPGARQTTKLSYAPPLAEPVRVFQMLGHSHAHSESFTVRRRPAGAAAGAEIVYQSFDWEEPRELTFNGVTVNPAPDATTRTDGGLTGPFLLNPGDTLEWECDVNNTSNAALHFANEAFTAEMCLLGGSYVHPTGGTLRAVCNGTCVNFPKGGGAL